MKNLLKGMNVFIPLVALVLLFTINTNAQKGEFGVRYMPTISSFDMTVSDGGVVQGEAVLGYGLGAFLGFNFTEHVGLQGELIYNSLSQKYVENDIETRVNLEYINVPVLFSLNSGKTNAVNLNLVAGPQIGFSVGSSVLTSGDNGDGPDPVVQVKSSDIGFAYGAGVDFGLTDAQNLRLGLGYRGVIGLVDISDKSNTTETDSYYVLEKTDLKTYSIYIGLSLLF